MLIVDKQYHRISFFYDRASRTKAHLSDAGTKLGLTQIQQYNSQIQDYKNAPYKSFARRFTFSVHKSPRAAHYYCSMNRRNTSDRSTALLRSVTQPHHFLALQRQRRTVTIKEQCPVPFSWRKWWLPEFQVLLK